MKKKCMIIVTISTIMLSLCACSVSAVNDNQESKQEANTISQPSLSQIRSICELATLECYYHNVAKSTKTKGEGLAHVGEKERTFWIEYTGVAKIGIDMSEIKMAIDGTNITITIPNATLINYRVKSIDEDSYILSADSWFNKNPITAAEQTKAVDDAEKNMKESIEKNTSLMVRAQERAKTLIENYVTQLGEASGVDYEITWVYSDEDMSDSVSTVISDSE